MKLEKSGRLNDDASTGEFVSGNKDRSKRQDESLDRSERGGALIQFPVSHNQLSFQ